MTKDYNILVMKSLKKKCINQINQHINKYDYKHYASI